MRGWRYLATRLNGDGTETFLSKNVRLAGATIEEVLSGAGGVKGTINPEDMSLRTGDGEPIFVPWSTAIYAEKDGLIRAGAILEEGDENGPAFTCDGIGFTGHLLGQPYQGEYTRRDIDPLDVVRHLWQHKQSQPDGNIGVQVDTVSSPVRIGNAVEPGKEEEGPKAYTLAWWKDHDMGKAIDDLAASTPFDYRVVHEWDGETIRHRLQLGHPTLGARRHDLSFVVGVNIFEQPPIGYDGGAYASHVVVLGAGEGRAMVRGEATRATGRLHRTVVVDAKDITRKAEATKAAAREVAARLGDPDLDTLTVIDHPNALLGSYSPGDEILVQTRPGWGNARNLWVRILAVSIAPEKDTATLTVRRVEKLESS